MGDEYGLVDAVPDSLHYPDKAQLISFGACGVILFELRGFGLDQAIELEQDLPVREPVGFRRHLIKCDLGILVDLIN